MFDEKKHCETNLSNHAIPCAIDLFAMLPIGHQVEIVGELYRLCDLFEDVYTEALATAFNVDPWISCLISRDRTNRKKKVRRLMLAQEVIFLHSEDDQKLFINSLIKIPLHNKSASEEINQWVKITSKWLMTIALTIALTTKVQCDLNLSKFTLILDHFSQ